MAISMIATLLKRLGAVCLVFVIYWHVTQDSAPRRGKAIVHVPEPGVLLFVDHDEYKIRTPAESPVVCHLEPGPHLAQVWRRGAMLGEERFTIEPGKEVVITPYHPHGRAIVAAGRPTKVVHPDGLAARIAGPRARAVAN